MPHTELSPEELSRIVKEHTMLLEAIEMAPTPFAVYDDEDVLVAWNPAYASIHPSVFENYDRTDQERIRYEDVVRITASKTMSGKELEDHVKERVKKQREEKITSAQRQYEHGGWYQVTKYITNSNAVCGFAMDINSLKSREDELEKASYILKETTDAMVQGIVMFHDGDLSFHNPMLLELLALDEGDVQIGMTFPAYMEMLGKKGQLGEGKEVEQALNHIYELVRKGDPYRLERTLKSGVSLRVDTVPLENDGMVIAYTDITDIKNREAELQETKTAAEAAQDRLQNAISIMDDGFVIFDPDDRLVVCNEVFREQFGKGSKFVVEGETYEDMTVKIAKSGVIPGVEGREEEFARSLVEKRKSEEGYTTTFQRHDGQWIRQRDKRTPSGDLVGVRTNITELKQREERLEQATLIAESAERAKSEFLANMSHEIRTPMNGVMGMAELLATTELDAKQKMFTDVIVKSGASLLTIINDILDFSKIDAGQMELDPAPFALAEAIEDVATLVSAKVAEKDLELIVRVDPALPKMMVGDVGRIRQIVTNLLGNAVKFTEKGHVYVNVDGQVVKNGDGEFTDLKFSVEDTGIGIPKDKCDQVFKKFSQVDTSATRKHEGTGLGLSIASSLVDLMGGEVGVESEVGQGSTFWFTARLPVHGETAPKQVIPGDMSGARILIVDDNEVNRSILSEQMTAWKFDSAATSTGAEGLEVMRAVLANGMDLDLVILDYQMPGMSGAEVLQEMRNDEALNDIPVVMLTSVDSSQTNQRLARLGAEANLTKPTRSSMLLETILQVVANKRADVKTRVQAAARPDAISGATPGTGSDAANNTPAAGSLQPDPNAPLDILVAEDNEVNQIVFRQILEETGLNFKIVENGRLAFASYKVQPPRMILMDVSMPEMNGKEATTAIRKYEREKEMTRTPIVGVTAHALKGDMEACIDAGMDDYLSKPVSPNKLILKVEQWLKLNLKQEAG